MSTEEKIKIVCEELKKILIEKNKKYGDSALNPIKVFSKEDNSKNSILIRLDDKISRIKNSNEIRKNDIWDLTGYLVLLIINNDWITKNEDIYE
jgi:hypothetical protein